MLTLSCLLRNKGLRNNLSSSPLSCLTDSEERPTPERKSWDVWWMGGVLFIHYPCELWACGFPSKTSCSALLQLPVNCLIPLKSQTSFPFSPLFKMIHIPNFTSPSWEVHAYVNSPWACIKMWYFFFPLVNLSLLIPLLDQLEEFWEVGVKRTPPFFFSPTVVKS